MTKSKIYICFAGIFALLAVLGWQGIRIKSQTDGHHQATHESTAPGQSHQISSWLSQEKMREQEEILATHLQNAQLLLSSEVQLLTNPSSTAAPTITLFSPETIPAIEQKPATIDSAHLQELLLQRFAQSEPSQGGTQLALVSLEQAKVYASQNTAESEKSILRLRQGNRPYFGSEVLLNNGKAERLTWTCQDPEKRVCIISTQALQTRTTPEYNIYNVVDGQILGEQNASVNSLWQHMKQSAQPYYAEAQAGTQNLAIAFSQNSIDNGLLLVHTTDASSLQHGSASEHNKPAFPFDWRSILLAVLAGLFVIAVGLLVVRRDILDAAQDSESLPLTSTQPAELIQNAEPSSNSAELRALKEHKEELEVLLKEANTRVVQLEEQYQYIKDAYQTEKKHRQVLGAELKTLQQEIVSEPTVSEPHPASYAKAAPLLAVPFIPAPKPLDLPLNPEHRAPKAQIDTEEVTNRELDAILDSSSSSALSTQSQRVEPAHPSTRITANIEPDDIAQGLGESEWDDIVSSFDAIMDASFPGTGIMKSHKEDIDNPESTLGNFGMQKMISKERKLSILPQNPADTPAPLPSKQASGLSPIPHLPPSFSPTSSPKDTLSGLAGLRKQSSPSLPLTAFPKKPSAFDAKPSPEPKLGSGLNTIPGSQKAIARIESGETAIGLAAVQHEAPSSHPLFSENSARSSIQNKVPPPPASSQYITALNSKTLPSAPPPAQRATSKSESGSFKPAPSWTGKKIQDAPNLDSNTLLDALKRRTRDVSQINMDPITATSAANNDVPSISKSGVFSVTGSRVDVDPLNDTEYYKSLYEKFIETKKACGESTDKLTLDRFISRLARNKESLMQTYQCKSVRFQVYIKDGKTALKATPIK